MGVQSRHFPDVRAHQQRSGKPLVRVKASMKTPARGPGDFGIAQCAESTLFMPEITKSVGTPKRFQHVSPFAFFEVGFIGGIVWVRFAFDLDLSFDGSALSVE